uniref:SHR-BD domain-containing protein n=1 Tax=Macrostomum lignano TaxID=282301 RepID=A0A1I8FJG1_9PLAT
LRRLLLGGFNVRLVDHFLVARLRFLPAPVEAERFGLRVPLEADRILLAPLEAERFRLAGRARLRGVEAAMNLSPVQDGRITLGVIAERHLPMYTRGSFGSNGGNSGSTSQGRFIRLCDSCQLIKPDRAHHCSTCGVLADGVNWEQRIGSPSWDQRPPSAVSANPILLLPEENYRPHDADIEANAELPSEAAVVSFFCFFPMRTFFDQAETGVTAPSQSRTLLDAAAPRLPPLSTLSLAPELETRRLDSEPPLFALSAEPA